LNLFMVPSGLNFILKIHLHPIGFEPGGRSTKHHVLLETMESISLSVASLQNCKSGDERASLSVDESLSILSGRVISFLISFLSTSIRNI
ncbi:hypothetical protein PJI17_31415, partial [Mycobacterium kansasii]